MNEFATNLLKILRAKEPSWVNARGNPVREVNFYTDDSRHKFDFSGALQEGWAQYDTDQDAWYFGVWVNVETREVLTYAEGDWQLVVCASAAKLAEELASMEKFYGGAPPALVVIDHDAKTVTEIFDTRPSVG